MLPLSDGLPARRFPVVNILLIVANFAVFILTVVLVPADRGELRAVQRLGEGGGVAFFAHVGGFVFGLVVTWLLARAGQVAPQEPERSIA
jgi:membrane associated rhomboid family serine protease